MISRAEILLYVLIGSMIFAFLWYGGGPDRGEHGGACQPNMKCNNHRLVCIGERESPFWARECKRRDLLEIR